MSVKYTFTIEIETKELLRKEKDGSIYCHEEIINDLRRFFLHPNNRDIAVNVEGTMQHKHRTNETASRIKFHPSDGFP